jgi:hypothetical protein
MKFKDALQKTFSQFKSPEFIKNIKNKSILPHLPLLQEITSYGFLPVEYQGGTRKETIRERAYLTGFITEKQAEAFIPNMSVYTDKVAIVVSIVKQVDLCEIPLTLKMSGKKIEITNRVFTQMFEEDYKGYCEELQISIKEPLVYLFCWDPLWGRDASSPEGLFYQVAGILKHIS